MSLVFLCGNLAAVGDPGVLERAPVHLGMEHSQPPGEIEVVANIVELGAIHGRHIHRKTNLPAREKVDQELGRFDGDRDLGLLGRGSQMGRDDDLAEAG